MKRFKNGGYVSNLYDEDDDYAEGGFIQDHWLDMLKTVGGGVATYFGAGSVGVPLIASGIGGMTAKDAEVNDMSNELVMPRTVGTNNMTPNVMSFAKGGSLSQAKANEILKDGKVHGKKLTAKQKKYMRAIGHGWKPSYENGGMIEDEMDDTLMELEGPKHEEGGIQFSEDAELEGGETVANGVVNSDRKKLKITKEDVIQYALPKSAIGKTVAEYSIDLNNSFKDREGDPIAMNTKKHEIAKVSQMSVDKSKQYPKSNKLHSGGTIPWHPHPHQDDRSQLARITDYMMNPWDEMQYNVQNNPIQEGPKLYPYTGGKDFKLGDIIYPAKMKEFKQNRPFFIPGKGWFTKEPVVNNEWNNRNKYPSEELPIVTKAQLDNEGVKADTPTSKNNSVVPDITKQDLNWNENYINGIPQRGYDPETTGMDIAMAGITKLPQIKGAAELNPMLKPNPNKAVTTPSISSRGINMDNLSGGLNTALGLAPLAIGAFQSARAAKEGYDTVKLPRLHADPYNPQFIDPQWQLDQVGDTFNTANEAMSQMSGKDYLRRRIQLATEEAKAKSGVRGQESARNAMIMNQKLAMDKQNALQTQGMNSQIALQEENINAANKGAYQTNRDLQLNNLGTMVGEYARDQKLTAANERYNDRMFDVLPNLFPGMSYDRNSGKWSNTGAVLPSGNSNTAYSSTSLRTTPIDTSSITPAVSTYPNAELEFTTNPGFNPTGFNRYPALNMYRGLYNPIIGGR